MGIFCHLFPILSQCASLPYRQLLKRPGQEAALLILFLCKPVR